MIIICTIISSYTLFRNQQILLLHTSTFVLFMFIGCLHNPFAFLSSLYYCWGHNVINRGITLSYARVHNTFLTLHAKACQSCCVSNLLSIFTAISRHNHTRREINHKKYPTSIIVTSSIIIISFHRYPKESSVNCILSIYMCVRITKHHNHYQQQQQNQSSSR